MTGGYIYNGILLNHKEEWNNAICSNMDGTKDYHSKCSKSDREKQISYDITYMWYLKKKNHRNELIYKTGTDRHRKQTYGYQRGKGGEG